jgi:tetratricopeptide (TPR) repeat protein
LLGLLIIGSFCAYLNYQYYSGSYVASTGIVKFITNSPEALSIKILSLGRSLLQSVFSFVPTPTPYYPGSILNVVGMTFLAISIFTMIKFRRRIIILFFIYSMLPLIVVNLKTTQVFGSDTYLLSTGIGIYLLIGILLNQFIKFKKSLKSKLLLILLYIIFLVPYAYLSFKVSKSFESSPSLFERAYLVEPTPFNLRVFVYQTQERGEYEKAYPYALRLFEWDPYAPFVDLVFGITIYKNRILKNEEKIMILQTAVNNHPDLPWIRYYLSLLYSIKEDYQRAYKVFEVFKHNDFLLFEKDLSRVLGAYLKFCKLSLHSCAELEMSINNFRKSSPLWNEELFNNSLNISF